MSYEEKSGQLIECVNTAHLYFGSIHYIRPDCVSKLRAKYLASPSQETYWDWAKEPIRAEHQIKEGVSRFDSDESWQASEALLKR